MRNKELTDEMLQAKMYGGWIGKNIGGTLGGPMENIMELMDINFYTQEFDGPMENDDLDLQLISLHAIEQYGARITAKHMENEWKAHVYFSYDEYGHAVTNMRKGIVSPMCGSYNNSFCDCMGAPIRSEIWAMVAAGNPELATYYAYQDAIIDHAGGEGVYGEIFFAALESMAFYEDNLEVLIEKSLQYIPDECQTAKAIRDVLKIRPETPCWKEARSYIIERYATDNPTYAPVNIAFTILCLLYGKDFSDAICIAASCGYDTDCTAATAGAIYGILYGYDQIPKKWIEPIGDKINLSTPIMGARAPKTIKELTERTIAARKIVLAEYENCMDKSKFKIDYDLDRVKYLLPEGSFAQADLQVTMEYADNNPVIEKKAPKKIKITIKNITNSRYSGYVSLKAPAGLDVSNKAYFDLQEGECFVYDSYISSSDFVNATDTVYDCEVVIEKYNYELFWRKMKIEFSLIPAMNWLVKRDDMTEFVELASHTNRIEFEKALEITADHSYIAKTNIYVPTDRKIDFIANTSHSISLLLDGEKLFSCDEQTPFIPAYHRSDAKKRKDSMITAGVHTVEITVCKDSEQPLDVVFMTVQPYPITWFVDGFFNYYIDVKIDR
ncbi:MAG: ADP-ribosylglycohydrolase family protein [Oscillospiraceae bacterium]